MVCLSRPYPFKFFKGCLPQNLLSPLLNTLSHLFMRICLLYCSFLFQLAKVNQDTRLDNRVIDLRVLGFHCYDVIVISVQ